jgi:RHS repeat-associated protein
LGSCPQAVCNPTINTSDNRFSSGQGYSYDENGSLTTNAEGKQFFYDAENHQKEVKNAQGQTIGLYLYDGDGRRVKKISASETVIFVYDGVGKLVAEYSTQVAPVSEAQVSYLTTDHLGSPRVITDQNGNVTKRQDYSAFGEETSTAQRIEGLGYATQDNVRQGYTGYQKDDESGLDFAQARYYNSAHGRFTSVDPLTASATIRNPQTFNRYSYVLNSPYKFTDPLGLIVDGLGCRRGCGADRSYYPVEEQRMHPPGANPAGVGPAAGPHNSQQGQATQQQPQPSTPTDPRLLPIPDDILSQMTGGDTSVPVQKPTSIGYVLTNIVLPVNGGNIVGPNVGNYEPNMIFFGSGTLVEYYVLDQFGNIMRAESGVRIAERVTGADARSQALLDADPNSNSNLQLNSPINGYVPDGVGKFASSQANYQATSAILMQGNLNINQTIYVQMPNAQGRHVGVFAIQNSVTVTASSPFPTIRFGSIQFFSPSR